MTGSPDPTIRPPEFPATSEVRTWLLVAISLAAGVLALHGTALTRWWIGDDPQILEQALEFPHLDYFFSPEAWQRLSPANLTPWVTFSFAVDFRLAGLNPSWFYAHQLASLFLVGTATFGLLRLWLSRWWAFAGAALFLSGPGSAAAAEQLALRHYVEGLLFLIVALHLYVGALRRNCVALAWLGAMFYVLALTAKEIYVPLALLLPLLPEGPLVRRLRCWLPYLLAAGVYPVWRWHMLGFWIGGYSHGPLITSATVLRLPQLALQSFFGQGAWALLAAVTTVLLVLYLAWQTGMRALWFVPAALLILSPIVPVAFLLEGGEARFLLLAWWATAVATASALGRLGARRLRVAVGTGATLIWIAMVVIAGARAAAAHAALEIRHARYQAEGMLIWTGRSDVALQTRTEAWYFSGLAWLRRHLTQSDSPRVLSDEIELQDALKGASNVFAYDEFCRCIRSITGEVPRILEHWRSKLKDTPLLVRMTLVPNLLSWQLGPYRTGTYTYVEHGTAAKTEIPMSGSHVVNWADGTTFRIRYDAPDGWIAYSALLRLTRREGLIRVGD